MNDHLATISWGLTHRTNVNQNKAV